MFVYTCINQRSLKHMELYGYEFESFEIWRCNTEFLETINLNTM